MAVQLREVEHSDFDQINRLFFEVYGKRSFQPFKEAFFKHQGLLGYCLEDDTLSPDTIVGYFGCFTYDRIVDGIDYKFYNTHTWIVKPEYRKDSLKLLMKYVRIKDGILTNFSANNTVAQILDQLKFIKLSIVNQVLTTPFSLKNYFKSKKIHSLPLQGGLLKHHEPYAGLCLLLQIPNGNAEIELLLKPVNRKPAWVQRVNSISKKVINKPIIVKNYFMYKVHYTSSAELLIDNFNVLFHYLLQTHKVGGLIIPSTLMNDVPSGLIKSVYTDTVYVKNNSSSLPNIDYLFSEVFYLNISDK